MFASVYAETVKVRVSLCEERKSSRQFMRRTSMFASVYAENVKVCVSLCEERQSLCQFMR